MPSPWERLTPNDIAFLNGKLFDKYRLDDVNQPWKHGTFSRVFQIGNRHLLRLSCATNRDGQEILHNAKIIDNLMETIDLLPFVTSRTYHIMPESNMMIIESILDEIDDIVPIEEWPDVFQTPANLLFALLEAGNELQSHGIIQRDISHNNTLLRRSSRKFVFIDADDACVPLQNIPMCRKPITGTPGFCLVEFDTGDTALTN